MVLAAGLEGIEQTMDPGDPNRDNMYELPPAELEARGIRQLPRSLGEALDCFEADPLSTAVMGRTMAEAWRDYKRAAWLSYTTHVSEWETARYLRFF